MSGIALVIQGANYENNKIDTVTFLEDVAVTGIAISMNASYNGQSFQPSVVYTPSTTNQKGVTWSITAGGTYATIDATTGLVTILSNANANSITIKAVSNYDNTVIATATTAVTYVATPVNPTALTISGSSTVSGQSSQYAVSYTPSNTNQTGVTWSITSGGSYATINANTGLLTILSGASSSTVVIKATSTADTSITATKSITVTYEVSQIGRTLIIASPVDSAAATSESTTNPISGKYWNKLSEVTNPGIDKTLIDSNNTAWFDCHSSSNGAFTAFATTLNTKYLSSYSTIRLPEEIDYNVNGYSLISGLTNNTGYDKSFFANAPLALSNASGEIRTQAYFNNMQNGTYRFRLYFNPAAVTNETWKAFSNLMFWGVNGQTVTMPNSTPSNILDSPVEINVTVDDGMAILYMGTTGMISGGAFAKVLNFIEIERTA